jgi:hypothetical protein
MGRSSEDKSCQEGERSGGLGEEAHRLKIA